MPNSSRLAWSNPDDISENLQTNDSDIGEFRGSSDFGRLRPAPIAVQQYSESVIHSARRFTTNGVMVTIEQLRFSYPGGHFRLHVRS